MGHPVGDPFRPAFSPDYDCPPSFDPHAIVADFPDPTATRLLNAMLGNSNVDPLTLTSEAATTLVARAQGMARLLKEA